MTMESNDSNKPEVERMKKDLGTRRFQSFEFNGGHQSAPAETFEKAMAWLNEKTSGKTGASGLGKGSGSTDVNGVR